MIVVSVLSAPAQALHDRICLDKVMSPNIIHNTCSCALDIRCQHRLNSSSLKAGSCVLEFIRFTTRMGLRRNCLDPPSFPQQSSGHMDLMGIPAEAKIMHAD